MLPSGILPNNHWGVLGVAGTLLADRVINRDAQVLYVSSTHALANDRNDGLSPDTPLATLAAAVAKCVANRGDTIYVAPKHVETIIAAGGLTINIAGVNVIGLGEGENRPTLTFSTAVGASVLVTAANVYVAGLLFKNNIASQTRVINVQAADFMLENCELREGTAKQYLIGVDLSSGANAADRARIAHCVFRSVAAGSNEAIELGAVQDRVELTDNKIFGDFANAGIHSASILTNLLVQRNEIRNIHAAKWSIQLTDAATGVIMDNRLATDAFATNLDPGSCMSMGNLGVSAIDTAGVTLPLVPGVAVQNTDYILTRPTEALPQTGTKTLFAVTGGPILVKQIFGTVTTIIGAVANATKLVAGATDICTTLEMNACANDARVSITGTFGGAMVKTLTTVPVAPQATAIVVPAGADLKVNCAGSDGGTGRIRWTLVYQPLESASTVTAP